MKTSGLIAKLAAAGAVAMTVAFAAAPASADFYNKREPVRVEFMHHGDHRMGDRMEHYRVLSWRDLSFRDHRDGRAREHFVIVHHEDRGDYGYRR